MFMVNPMYQVSEKRFLGEILELNEMQRKINSQKSELKILSTH
jgi:hypothetical protein